LLLMQTLTKHSHYPRHDISLPLSLLVKGIRGRFGWGMGINWHYENN
jgi:hypothetical protein